MKNIFRIIKLSPIFPLVICFLFLNIFSRGDGATNEMSRYATMRAMSDQGTFQINSYKDWTVDWSIKDGKIFSNKAPAPMLLGFPLFFVIDKLTQFDKKQKRNEQGHRITKVSSTPRVIMALFLQLLPLIVLCSLIANWLKKENYKHSSIIFFGLATLFGNTSALFMNFLFGHGMAAIFVLSTSFALIQRKYKYVGLFYGLTLLSEYTAALLIVPLFCTILYQNKKNIDWMKPLVFGALFPAVLWCWYHASTVGSIFSVPAQYQNPLWITESIEKKMLWGMFYLPSLDVFIKLLIGSERGILVTQPWVLILIPVSFYYYKILKNEKLKALAVFCTISLLLLLIMNSSFNNWHGGATSGPRYLSMIFPSFALLGAMCLNEMKSRILRISIFCGLGVSLVFRTLVYGARATSPEKNPLWSWLFDDLLQKDGMKGELRALLFVILLSIALYMTMKKR